MFLSSSLVCELRNGQLVGRRSDLRSNTEWRDTVDKVNEYILILGQKVLLNWDRNVWLSKRKGLEKEGRLEVVLRHICARPIFSKIFFRFYSCSNALLILSFQTFEPRRLLVIGCEV